MASTILLVDNFDEQILSRLALTVQLNSGSWPVSSEAMRLSRELSILLFPALENYVQLAKQIQGPLFVPGSF